MQNIFPNKQEKEKLLTQLNLLGAKHVYVEFRGTDPITGKEVIERFKP